MNIEQEIKKINTTLEKLTGNYGSINNITKELGVINKSIEKLTKEITDLKSTGIMDIVKGGIILTMAKRINNIEEILTKEKK